MVFAGGKKLNVVMACIAKLKLSIHGKVKAMVLVGAGRDSARAHRVVAGVTRR
jgi:hypothetical protein